MLFFGVNFVISNQSGDHPLEDLAKFGYNLNMKFKFKKKKSFYICGYQLEACTEIWNLKN
jgi:hypothetical protein